MLIANENKRHIVEIEIYFRISQTMLGSKKPFGISQLICRGRLIPCICSRNFLGFSTSGSYQLQNSLKMVDCCLNFYVTYR